MHNRIIHIEQDHIGSRYDYTISHLIPDISRTRVQSLMDDGCVLSDGVAITCGSKKIKRQCVITIIEKSSNNDNIIKIKSPKPENIAIEVIYEDKYIAIIDKPAGIVCHPAPGNYEGTLLNAIIYRFGTEGIGPQCRYGMVHRLDKDTSGLMLIAKNTNSHYAFSKMFLPFEDKAITRKYICFCNNTPDPKQGTIDNLITRDPRNRQRYTVLGDETNNVGIKNITTSHMDMIRNKRFFKDNKNSDCIADINHSGARRAITHYKTIASHCYSANKTISMLECELKTGRTHQIRVHMKHIGCHILGDKVYGVGNNRNTPSWINCIERQALHAYHMEFTHPFLGKHMEFKSKIPDDLASIEKIFQAT